MVLNDSGNLRPRNRACQHSRSRASDGVPEAESSPTSSGGAPGGQPDAGPQFRIRGELGRLPEVHACLPARPLDTSRFAPLGNRSSRKPSGTWRGANLLAPSPRAHHATPVPVPDGVKCQPSTRSACKSRYSAAWAWVGNARMPTSIVRNAEPQVVANPFPRISRCAARGSLRSPLPVRVLHSGRAVLRDPGGGGPRPAPVDGLGEPGAIFLRRAAMPPEGVTRAGERRFRTQGQGAGFGACRPGNSVHAGHPFRRMPATHFGPCRPLLGPKPKWVADMPRWERNGG